MRVSISTHTHIHTDTHTNLFIYNSNLMQTGLFEKISELSNCFNQARLWIIE